MGMAVVGGAILFYLLLIAGSITCQILLGLATYNDAKARMNDNPVMWGWLVGIFGLIPGIIYLATRNNSSNRMIVCPNCGWANPGSAPNCARCGAPNQFMNQFLNPQAGELAHKAKLQLIWGLVILGVSIILCFVGIALFVGAASAYGSKFSYNYNW